MNISYPRLTTGLLLAIVSTSASATTPIARQPAPGVTAQARQRLAPAFAVQLEQRNAAFRQAKADAELAFQALAPERARIDKALAADPRYQAYVAQVQNISAGKGDAEEKARRIGELARANRAVIEDALRTAKFDRSRIQSRLGRGTLSEDLELRIPLNLPQPAGSVRATALPSPQSPPSASPTTLVLEPPFDYQGHETNDGGLSARFTSALVADGRATMIVGLLGLVGDASGSAEIGTSVTIPAGVRRIRVTADVEGSYQVAAASAVAVSASCASYELRVISVSTGRTSGLTQEGDCISAAIAWFADDEAAYTRSYTVNVEVPANDREFLIFTRASAWGSAGGAPGFAKASGRVKPRRFTVQFFHD